LALLASSAIWAAPTGNPAATEEGTVAHFKQVMEGKLKNWDEKISLLKDKADASNRAKEARLKTAVRDLEVHRDRIREEMKRMSENETPVINQTAEASIDRHFREMDKLFAANRAPGAGQPKM